MPTPRREEPLASFIAFVRGEDEVNQTISRVHGLRSDELREAFEDHRDELQEIDATREAILDGLYGSLHRRPRQPPDAETDDADTSRVPSNTTGT